MSNPSRGDMQNIANKQSELQTLCQMKMIGELLGLELGGMKRARGVQVIFFSLEKRSFESKLIPRLDMNGVNCEVLMT